MEKDIHNDPADNAGRWCSRTFCAAVEDARSVLKAHIKYLKGSGRSVRGANLLGTLLEEIQVYGNRMEAALEEYAFLKDTREEVEELKKEKDELKKEIEELSKVEKLNVTSPEDIEEFLRDRRPIFVGGKDSTPDYLKKILEEN